jgi:hypothetical protein
MFRELVRVSLRKAERLAKWARIRGLKKSWFGNALRPQAVRGAKPRATIYALFRAVLA